MITDLPGRGLGGNIIPGQAGGELPENILKDLAVVERWAAAGGGRKKRLEEMPLGVGEEGCGGVSHGLSGVGGKMDYLIKKR